MFDPFLTEKQILRKLGGDKNPGKVITFDGNLSGKEAFEIEPGVFFVKLSDDVYDLNNTESITIFDFDGEKTYQKDAFTIGYNGPMCSILLNERPYVLVISEDIPESLSKGLWITYMTDNGFFVYPSKIQIAGTIVPIDQKYLPGVCLPVVELSTTFSPGTAIDGEDQKKLWDAYKNGAPAVIVCDISIGNVSYQNARMVWSVAKLMGDVTMNVFVASVGSTMLMIYSIAVVGETEGAWNCAVQ